MALQDDESCGAFLAEKHLLAVLILLSAFLKIGT